ncbi:MAG: pilus assembly protein [Pseudomonadales bacterium]|nr:pilus assembly protein [Pseudomonadales bacterium]|tara:strand:+ start:5569 stop:7413 length:1845 start_codon:yes stop_codon:yes gene_type:complete
MSVQIRTAQSLVLKALARAGKITDQQASTQPPSENLSDLIPDVLRICKDDEAVQAAVAEVNRKPAFSDLEDGLTLIQSPEDNDWVIVGNTLYLTNLYDTRANARGMHYGRTKGIHVAGLGCISHSQIERLRSFEGETEESELDDESLKAQAAKRVEEMIRVAAQLDASDIHLQPTQGDQVAVRYRIDGDLITHKLYKNTLHEAIARITIENLCNLSLQTSVPQDGKFEFQVSSSKKINLRVSSIPVSRASDKPLKLVFRLLGNNGGLANLHRLGMSRENVETLQRLGSAPNGMIILTGPTGSGKTTTLNALLLDISGRWPNKNYHTLEEPVELQHEGMSHTEVGPGVSFADGLRSLLRQDPDVLLVGEMRDPETASLGFTAAMTGHLVLSTLHTNNAHESFGRLARMGVDPEIIVTNTTAFIAQRLIKTLCQSCRVAYELRTNSKQLATYGNHPAFAYQKGATVLYRANPNGCSACKANESHNSAGLKGRRGIIEILEITPDVQNAILDGENLTLMRRRQISEGTFKDLWDDGLRLVADGIVGIEQLEANLKPFIEDRAPIKGRPVHSLNTTQVNGEASVEAIKSPSLSKTASLGRASSSPSNIPLDLTNVATL